MQASVSSVINRKTKKSDFAGIPRVCRTLALCIRSFLLFAQHPQKILKNDNTTHEPEYERPT